MKYDVRNILNWSEEQKQDFTLLIDARIAHRKAEEKFFYEQYEKTHPYKERLGNLREYIKEQRTAKDKHMEEYDKRIAAN